MEAVRVRPSGPLSGTVKVSGATKNSGLKQLAAALLASGVTQVRNLPRVRDLDVMLDVLRAVGAEVEWTGDESLAIDTSGPLQPEAPYELVRRMRASINVLGPLVARCGEARVALPGGDNIGSRRLDMHVRGLEAMGAEIVVEHGFIHAKCSALCGTRIVLEFPSVGATEQLLTAAVLAKGETVIENAAREPGDHRPHRVPQSHGRARDRRGDQHDHGRGRRRARRAPTPRSWAIASRPAPT